MNVYLIRLPLTSILLYIVYHNSHWSVFLVLALITISTELQNKINRRHRDALNAMLLWKRILGDKETRNVE